MPEIIETMWVRNLKFIGKHVIFQEPTYRLNKHRCFDFHFTQHLPLVEKNLNVT